MSAERGWPGKGDPLLSPHTEGSPQSWVGRGKGGPRCPSSPYGEGVPCKGGPRGEGDPLSAPHPPQSGGQQIRGGPLYTLRRGISTAPQCPPLNRAPPHLPTEWGSQVRGAPPLPSRPPRCSPGSPPRAPLPPGLHQLRGLPFCPPPSGIHQGAPPFPPSPQRGVPGRGGGGWGVPCGGFPDAEQGVDLCFSFKSHLSPQVLAQESLATGVTGVMVPAGTVTQPLLIPISIAGQVTGQQALALVTIPTATLAALPGLTPAAPAGAIFKPPVANLTGNRR